MLKCANQQVTSSWFTGILEGEGCFQRIKQSSRVRIFNHDLDIIMACEEFLERNDIEYVRYTMSKVANRKRIYEILIKNSFMDLKDSPTNLYNLIKTSLQCRQRQYQQILGTSETLCEPSIDLDWLIGIWEAEGSFSLILRNDCAQFEINLGNTNFDIIKKVSLNLHDFGCAHYIYNKNQANRKPAKIIKICGMKRCLKFLQKTNNKWIAWRNEKRCSLMLEFITTRLAMHIKEPYTEEQFSIIQSVKDLNR